MSISKRDSHSWMETVPLLHVSSKEGSRPPLMRCSFYSSVSALSSFTMVVNSVNLEEEESCLVGDGGRQRVGTSFSTSSSLLSSPEEVC